MTEASDTLPSTSRTNSASTQNAPSLIEALGALQNELFRFKSAVDHIEHSKEAAREALESAKQVGEAAVALACPTQTLVNRLDKVDFPSRLDKLDATVATLQIGLQNTQGRFDKLDATMAALQIGLQNTQHRLDKLEDNLRGNMQNVVDIGVSRVGNSIEAKTNGLTQTIMQHAKNQANEIRQLRILVLSLAGLGALLALIL